MSGIIIQLAGNCRMDDDSQIYPYNLCEIIYKDNCPQNVITNGDNMNIDNENVRKRKQEYENYTDAPNNKKVKN